MTREEFIKYLPGGDTNIKEMVIQMVDEGLDVLGITDEKGIQDWYHENFMRLFSTGTIRLIGVREDLASEYATKRFRAKYENAREIGEREYEYFFVRNDVERITSRINDIILKNEDLIQVDPKVIIGIAVKYYFYYEYRLNELKRLESEVMDEISFVQLDDFFRIKDPVSGDDSKVKGIRIYLSRNKKKYVDISSDWANKLFSDVVVKYFYDLFRNNSRDLDKLQKQLDTLSVAKKKIKHRVIHEMYAVFVENGYLQYNNTTDLYKLGSSGGKYVSSNNNVSRWIYTVFAELSGVWDTDDPNVLDWDLRKTIRDCLVAYAKNYHQDDFKFPYDIEKAYSWLVHGKRLND